MDTAGNPQSVQMNEDVVPARLDMKTTSVNVEGNGSNEEQNSYQLDMPAVFNEKSSAKRNSGGLLAGILLLVNQGLVTLAFFGVSINLVLFLTRVLEQKNADAANNVSKWTGVVYLFSLFGAFLSDSYWGRYKTCTVFQVIFVLGLSMLTLFSHKFLIKPHGCGDRDTHCKRPSNLETHLFYLAIYMVALGYGGYQPNSASFGADQFVVDDNEDSKSKFPFFSYFYLALNIGSIFSNTFLSYTEDQGRWSYGFGASVASAVVGLVLFLCGTSRYKKFKPGGNPLTRVCQVVVAASRKWRNKLSPDGEDLYEIDDKESQIACQKMTHTEGFKFLDRAAYIDSNDLNLEQPAFNDPWQLTTVTQVEELKCVLRLLPIWLCSFLYSVVFTQMASMFVVQGAAMKTTINSFSIPPSSMTIFDIMGVAITTFFCRRLLYPIVGRLRKKPEGLTEIEKMGVGLVIAVMAMVSAGLVEYFRLKQAIVECFGCDYATSSLHMMWQVPQYVLIGASEVFMYVGQLEFFNKETPEGLKTFGSALCMSSMALGNFLSDLIVTIVMAITTKNGQPGWIPDNLNDGRLDNFYFLLAGLTSIDFVVYIYFAIKYKTIKFEARSVGA